MVLNKRMMLPKDSAQYCGILNAVVDDFMVRLRYVRHCSPTGDLVMDLANEFYRFSLEGKCSSWQFCLSVRKPVAELFAVLPYIFFCPTKPEKLSVFWCYFCNSLYWHKMVSKLCLNRKVH